MAPLWLVVVPLLVSPAVQRSVHGDSTPGDVFLILADDVAYEDLEPLMRAGLCPNLAKIASVGTTFRSAYANGTCSPTRQSLELGRWRAGEMHVCSDFATSIPEEELTLAELNPSGYSALIGKWHAGSNPNGAWPDLYWAFGYEHWFGTPTNVGNCEGTNYTRWTRVVDGVLTYHVSDYQPRALINDAARWWRSRRGLGRFLDYRPSLAHVPFHEPPPGLLPPGYEVEQTARARFEAMIIALDSTLGPILADIDWDQDLVIFIGDNGTPSQVSPVRGKAKSTVYERGIHVPLIVSGPGFRHESVDRLVHVADIYPTLAEFWGTPYPRVDGIPLTDPRGHDWIVVSGNDDLGVRWNNLKLRKVVGDQIEMLFDLASDPSEEENVLDDPRYAPELAVLRGILAEFEKRQGGG